MPVEMVMEEPAIPHGWEVTSDSLSAWLCGRLRADGLLLVKSTPQNADNQALKALIDRNVIDSAFARFIPESGVPVWLLAKTDSARLEKVLAGNMDGATRIVIDD